MCGEANCKLFFDLGAQPLANSLLNEPDEREGTYPLALMQCERCSLVQLTYTIPPEQLFSHYVWVTGTSKGAQEFSEIFYKELVARTDHKKDGYVLEIASNDGTFLFPFQKNGYSVLGVDPAKNVVAMAQRAGIPTEDLFWNTETAAAIYKKRGPAHIIFARNVLAHVASPRNFVEGVAKCLEENGVAAIEAHYAGDIVDGLQYDSIYHEHLCYFTLKPMERLLNDHGLHVFDILKSPISGGAIVVYASKRKREESRAVQEYRAAENKKEVNTFEMWKIFAKRSYDHREKMIATIGEIKKANRTIIGWGASARSSTLLNFCGIDSKLISTIIDMNPLKQGKYTAGSHIRVVSAEEGIALKPDCICVTGWNFANEIMDTAKNIFKYSGDYLIPLPNEPKIKKGSSQ